MDPSTTQKPQPPFQEVPVNYFPEGMPLNYQGMPVNYFTEWNSVPTPSPDRPQGMPGNCQAMPVNYFTEWNSVPTFSPDRPQGMPGNCQAMPVNYFTEWNSVSTPSPDRPQPFQEVPVNYFPEGMPVNYFTESDFVPTPSPDRPDGSVPVNYLPGRNSVPTPLPNRSQEGNANRRWLIYKVPDRLRAVKEKAYEPNVISIGPYHYGKAHLMAMQVIKWSCFSKIAEETGLDFSEFLNAMMPFEDQARSCYEGPCCLCSQAFVEMMILDGCFIVQLIRKIYPEDDIFTVGRIQTDIRNDLLLLENQLPFFVLLELDRMITPNGGGDLDRSALSLFKTGVQLLGPEVWPKSENCPALKKDIKHLLDLVHDGYRPSPQGIKQHNDFKAKTKNSKPQRSWKFIRSATELEEAGIKFGEKVKDHDQDQEGLVSLFDIEFTNGTKVLKIPTLRVDDNTERILRNYMAYEQFFPREKPTYIVDYVVFMDNLINTGKDVQLLCNSGVIDNWLGDDEAVAEMFNKLRDSIYMSEDFYYTEIFGRVNEHCQRKWNKWKATLRKKYFNSPWSLASFLAAVTLLLLTLLQSIFSVLSYVKQQQAGN